MNKKEYQSLRQGLERTRDAAVASAEAEFKQSLEALDHLWEVAGAGGSSGRTAKKAGSRRSSGKKTTRRKSGSKKTGRGRRRGGKTLIDSMREAVHAQSGQFTIADIKQSLADSNQSLIKNTNPAVFSTTIRRLESMGEITCVERGKGRRASIYKKATAKAA